MRKKRKERRRVKARKRVFKKKPTAHLELCHQPRTSRHPLPWPRTHTRSVAHEYTVITITQSSASLRPTGPSPLKYRSTQSLEHWRRSTRIPEKRLNFWHVAAAGAVVRAQLQQNSRKLICRAKLQNAFRRGPRPGAMPQTDPQASRGEHETQTSPPSTLCLADATPGKGGVAAPRPARLPRMRPPTAGVAQRGAAAHAQYSTGCPRGRRVCRRPREEQK